jgi:tetratricopeptide (TPR) repeat protein
MAVATAEESVLGGIRAACDAGRYLDAFAALDRTGGVQEIREVEELVLASRIMRNLGAPRHARLLAIRARRLDRRDDIVAYHYSTALEESRGPWEALTFLRRFPVSPSSSPTVQALFRLKTAALLLVVRDFEEAHRLWKEAASLWTDPTLWVSKAAIFAASDSWTAAEEAASRALELAPTHRQALQAMAGCLVARGRSDEAERLLAERGAELQSPYLLLQRAQLCCELDRPRDAKELLRAASAMMPLPESRIVSRFSGLAADIDFKLGEVESAIRFYRMAAGRAQLRLAARLEEDLPERRILLGVPQVRQDHKTCAPATLTALCRFFERPAEQVSIVEEICYDGTPAANERRWAESHGFAARHFTVTWDAAVSLIDHGLPFALQTIDVSSAHLQAVVGYDVRRGSFLVRDPSTPVLVEMDAAAMLKAQASVGPQGMVMVPSESRQRLDEVMLPDQDLRERLYRLQVALLEHRRDDGERELRALEQAAPTSVVAMMGARALAVYDGNQADQLVAWDRLLAVYPDAPAALFARLSCLEGLERTEHRRRELFAAATRPDAHPVLKRMWGEELVRDGRQAAMAGLWLGAAIRANPQDAQAYFRLAELASARDDRAATCELLRVASCIEDANELGAISYFRAMRLAGQAEHGVSYLRRRVERLGRRAGAAWVTLYTALAQLNRVKEAEEVLVSAREALPENGAILLEAAWAALRHGRTEEAARLGESARTRVKETDLAPLEAELARLAGRRDRAIARWRAVVATSPLAIEAYVSLTRLLTENGQRDEARLEVLEATSRYPHHAGLARLLVEATDDEGAEGLEVVRRLVALAPQDAWARRALSLRLAQRQKMEEALRELDEAFALDPTSSASHGVRGVVLKLAGRKDEAREALRKALSVWADNVPAFAALLDLAHDDADGLRAIRFLQAELRRQVVFGGGLGAWRRTARGRVPDEEILAFLEEARSGRPDLLACWDIEVAQLEAMGRLEEARARATEMAIHFPYVIEALIRKSEVEGRCGDLVARRRTLEAALEIEPAHAAATRALAELLVREGKPAHACRRLERLVEQSPLDLANVVTLADLHDRLGRRSEALAAVRRTLERNPTAWPAWELLAQWCRKAGRDTELVATAAAVVAARPESAAALVGCASVLTTRSGRELEALTMLDKALTCEPNRESIHDQRATLLTHLRRFDDALLACKPEVFGLRPPMVLRGRHAWVLAQKGELNEAIREMEVVVGESPSYVWGLLQLGSWYLYLRKRSAALRAYGLAMVAQPGSVEAALGSFEAARALSDFDTCERALASIREEGAAALVESRRVALACSRGRSRAALTTFAQLCNRKDVDLQSLTLGGRSLVGLGQYRRALRILRRAIEEAPNQEVLGTAWAELIVPLFEPLIVRQLSKLLSRGRAGEAAIGRRIDVMVSRRQFFDFVLAVLVGGRAWRTSARVWAYVGYGLLSFGRYRWAMRWLSDHATRPDVQPWMLGHVVAALVSTGQMSAAKTISQRVVDRESDAELELHSYWLAFHSAAEGNLSEARQRVRELSRPRSEIARALEAYTRAVAGATTEEGEDVARRAAALMAVDAQYDAQEPRGFSVLIRRVVRKAGSGRSANA